MSSEIEMEIQEIAEQAKSIHIDERRVTMLSVRIVAELDQRNAAYHLGISVEQLALYIGLSPSQYYKRLKAAKIMHRFPYAREIFEKGETSISHLAMAGNKITQANSEVLLNGIRNKSKREVEDFLGRVSSGGRILNYEPILERTFRLKLSEMALFDRVLEVLASQGQVATANEGLLTASELYLDRHDPMRLAARAALCANVRDLQKAEDERDGKINYFQMFGVTRFECDTVDLRNEPQVANEPGEDYTDEELQELFPFERVVKRFKNKLYDPRRPIRASVRNRIWLRDGGVCTFQLDNGERCKERTMLEIEHVEVVSRSGGKDESNLTLRCPYHSQLTAKVELGTEFMNGDIQRSARAEDE